MPSRRDRRSSTTSSNRTLGLTPSISPSGHSPARTGLSYISAEAEKGIIFGGFGSAKAGLEMKNNKNRGISLEELDGKEEEELGPIEEEESRSRENTTETEIEPEQTSVPAAPTVALTPSTFTKKSSWFGSLSRRTIIEDSKRAVTVTAPLDIAISTPLPPTPIPSPPPRTNQLSNKRSWFTSETPPPPPLEAAIEPTPEPEPQPEPQPQPPPIPEIIIEPVVTAEEPTIEPSPSWWSYVSWRSSTSDVSESQAPIPPDSHPVIQSSIETEPEPEVEPLKPEPELEPEPEPPLASASLEPEAAPPTIGPTTSSS
ncbi:hypothetical protein H0H93_005870, partial [Arthromyces matolae]